MISEPTFGALCALGAALAWSVTGVLAAHAGRGRPGSWGCVRARLSTVLMKPPLREIEPLTAQAIRLPVASALLWLTPWTRGAGAALRDGEPGSLLLIAVLSVVTAASSVLFVASLKYAGVAVGAVLSSTAPLFAIPLGVVFLGERVSIYTVIGAVIAVAGIVVLQL